MKERDELFEQRKQKMKEFSSRGIDPYPHRFKRTKLIQDIIEEFKGLKPESRTGKSVILAGRVIRIRRMGKASFSHIKDVTGMIQIYVRSDNIGKEGYDIFGMVDIGDHIGIEGEIFATKTGELSIDVKRIDILSKSLRPLPEKWHGLKDVETRYRQRYLDLIANDKVRDVFIKRTEIMKAIRQFLEREGFLEVETPILQPVFGGARAKPFTTHHNVLDEDLFLRIAPELYLKRLIVGGFEKIYELNRSFRNEGISIRHNPEFTMLELYQSYADYNDMMDLCERLFVEVCKGVIGDTKIKYQGETIDLGSKWDRISLYDLMKKYTGKDFSNTKRLEDIRKLARSLKIEFEDSTPEHKIFDHIFDSFVKPNLMNPTFVMDYPTRFSPLAKQLPGDKGLVERFELFIGREELANAYSELNDPIEQRTRMEEQIKRQARERDEEKMMFDEDFIRALEHGMPPCGGLGIGIDRMVMVFTDSSSLRDVIFFPQMRKETQVDSR